MTDTNGTKECPYCREEIKYNAIKCKHCHAMLEENPNRTTVNKIKTKKPAFKSRWSWILPTALITILSIFTITFLYLNKQTDQDLSQQSDNYSKTLKDNDSFNASANITNRGIAAMKDDWFYYQDDKALYKMRADGSEQQLLLEEYALYLNVLDDSIYYLDIDNEYICKVSTDGTAKTKIANDFARDLTHIDGWLYYYASGSGICKITVDGAEKMLLKEDRPVLTLCIYDDWIYYIVIDVTIEDPFSCNVYKVDTEGGNKTKLNDVNSTNLNVTGGWIYYSLYITDQGSTGIYKMDLDGNNVQSISDLIISNLNIQGDWMYFTNSDDGGSLYKMKTDGSKLSKLNNEQSEFINVVGDWIFYSNFSDEKNLYRIRTDGSERQSISEL